MTWAELVLAITGAVALVPLSAVAVVWSALRLGRYRRALWDLLSWHRAGRPTAAQCVAYERGKLGDADAAHAWEEVERLQAELDRTAEELSRVEDDLDATDQERRDLEDELAELRK